MWINTTIIRFNEWGMETNSSAFYLLLCLNRIGRFFSCGIHIVRLWNAYRGRWLDEFSFECFTIPKPNYHLLAQINLKYDDCLSQCNWCRTNKSQVWTEFGIWMKANRHHHHHHHAYCVCFDGDLLCTLFIPFRFDHHLKKR